MQVKGTRTKIIALLTVSIFISSFAFAADSLDVLGADTFFCLRVNNLEYTLGQTDQYISGISPIPLGLSMLTRVKLAGILGSPELKGLEMGQSFTLFAAAVTDLPDPQDPMANVFFGMLVPVSDFDTFVSSNSAFETADSENIARLNAEDMPPMIVAPLYDEFAVVTTADNYEKLISFKQKLEKTSANFRVALDSDVIDAAGSNNLWLYFDVEAAMKAMGPAAAEQLSQLQMTAQQFQPQAAAAPDASEMLEQINYLSLGLKVTPELLTVTQSMMAKSGSELAAQMSPESIEMLSQSFAAFINPDLSLVTSLIEGAESADFAGTVNLLQLMTMVAGDAQVAEAESHLAFSVKSDSDVMTAIIALPKKHLLEVFTESQKMQAAGLGGGMSFNPFSSKDLNATDDGGADFFTDETEVVDEPVVFESVDVDQLLPEAFYRSQELWNEYLDSSRSYWNKYEARRRETTERIAELENQLSY